MQKKVASALGFCLIVFVVVLRFLEEEDGGSGKTPPPSPNSQPPSQPQPQPQPAKGAETFNGYQQLPGCRLVDHRNNDGDSFFVRYGDREFELRLYFADCAEKYYSDRYEDQRKRVRHQAEDFGGLTIDQTIELGETAKKVVGIVLSDGPFTIYTNWERVYGGERFHGFVEIEDPKTEGEKIFLNEWLVREGLARIHTGGAPAPDGRSQRQFEADLEALEREAKQAKRGAWKL